MSVVELKGLSRIEKSPGGRSPPGQKEETGESDRIQQQAILNDAAEQLLEAGGLTALTQAHFNEAMKRRPINGPIPEKAPGGLHTAKFSRPS